MKRISFITLTVLFFIHTGFTQTTPMYTIDRNVNFFTPSHMLFTPDGKSLAYGTTDGQVIIKNMKTGDITHRLGDHDKMVISLAFTPDGKILASGDKNGHIKIWNLKEKKEITSLKAHRKAVMALSYTPDGSRLFSGSRDNTIRIWETGSYEEKMIIRDVVGNIKWIISSPDGKEIIAATSALMKGIRIYDAESGDLIKEIESSNTLKICMTPDATTLLTAVIGEELHAWDINTKRRIKTITGHTENAQSVDLSPGGKILVSGAKDMTVRLWDWKNRKQLYLLGKTPKEVDAVAYSPNGKYVAASSWDNQIRVWDLTSLNLPEEDIYTDPEDIPDVEEEDQEVIDKTFQNLLFETDKAVIKSSSHASLDDLATLLKNKPQYKLLIRGHTDNVGNATHNYKLSIQRADAVADYLAGKGVDRGRLTAQGFGATKPVASNQTEEGRKKNRRVELVLRNN